MVKKVKAPVSPGVRCHVQNRDTGTQVFYNNQGKMVSVPPGQTVSVEVSQATFDQMKQREIATHLIFAKAGPKGKPVEDDKFGSVSAEVDGTGDYVEVPDKMPDNDPSAEGLAGLDELGGEGDDAYYVEAGQGAQEVTAEEIQRRLTDVNALLTNPPRNFAAFKSQARKLFGDAWPGDTIKKDELMVLLQDCKVQLEELRKNKQEE